MSTLPLGSAQVPIATIKKYEPEWVKPFLREYALCGNMQEACDKVGIKRVGIRVRAHRKPGFKRRLKIAKARFRAQLEAQHLAIALSTKNTRALEARLAAEWAVKWHPAHQKQAIGSMNLTQINVNLEERGREAIEQTLARMGRLSEQAAAQLEKKALPCPTDSGRTKSGRSLDSALTVDNEPSQEKDSADDID